MKEPWYRQIFADFARGYDQELFTQGTLGEVDFFERELAGDRSARILDLGCGTGRHSVELARRGYEVVGVDLSPAQLARATQKAAEAGVEVDFREGDARHVQFEAEFDLVLLVCEAALNALYPLGRLARGEQLEGYFDLLTLRNRSSATITTDSGAPLTVDADERYYLPSEMTWLLHQAGMREVEIFGCDLGAFSRKRALGCDDMEMLALGVR